MLGQSTVSKRIDASKPSETAKRLTSKEKPSAWLREGLRRGILSPPRRIVAHHRRLVVQKQRPPLAAHPHRRMNRPPMHLVAPPRAVRIAVVVEVPERPHPPIPRPDVRLHVLQRQRKPQPPQPLPHMLRHPVLVIVSVHAHPPLTRTPPLQAPVTSAKNTQARRTVENQYPNESSGLIWREERAAPTSGCRTPHASRHYFNLSRRTPV